MNVPELLVIRHGETEWNRAGRWQGKLDSPLTQKGEAQARAIGQLLKQMGVNPDTHSMWCSPQGRAQRTAELALGQGIAQPDERLKEIDVGAFSGKTRDDVFELANLPEDAPFLDYYRAAPGGESFDALFYRVDDFLSELRQPAVIVTHGITSRFLRTCAMGWTLERIEELPGGQGVIHRINDGKHETLAP